MKKKILMLGWEFSPQITGGLGVASQGIAKGLTDLGHQVTFFMPRIHFQPVPKEIRMVEADALKPDRPLWQQVIRQVEKIEGAELGAQLTAYLPPAPPSTASSRPVSESQLLENVKLTGTYHGNLFAEVVKYALLALQQAGEDGYDLVHCHDWLTLRGGRMIKEKHGLPFYAHIHSTEHDRNGIFADPLVSKEEQLGLEEADHIFTVSQKVAKAIIEHYGIAKSRITVVPNATDIKATPRKKNKGAKTIAFIGRLTEQKNPWMLVDLARDLTTRGLEYNYLVIGDGYLKDGLINKARTLNLIDRVKFPGFLTRESVLSTLPGIDLLVCPSKSEPFGLVMLEAIHHKVPVIAARDSGLSEFVPSLPQADNWDVFSYSRLVEQILEDPAKAKEITTQCLKEAKKLTWKKSCEQIAKVYLKKK